MNWQNMIGGLLDQYTSGTGAANRQEAHEHYDQIAGAVPTNVLGSVIGPALAVMVTTVFAATALVLMVNCFRL